MLGPGGDACGGGGGGGSALWGWRVDRRRVIGAGAGVVRRGAAYGVLRRVYRAPRDLVPELRRVRRLQVVSLVDEGAVSAVLFAVCGVMLML